MDLRARNPELDVFNTPPKNLICSYCGQHFMYHPYNNKYGPCFHPVNKYGIEFIYIYRQQDWVCIINKHYLKVLRSM